MPDFTGGEWEYEEFVPEGITINGTEYIIYTGSVNPDEEGEDIALAKRETDARLIVAAPEMYNALRCVNGLLKDPRITGLLARIEGKEDAHE